MKRGIDRPRIPGQTTGMDWMRQHHGGNRRAGVISWLLWFAFFAVLARYAWRSLPPGLNHALGPDGGFYLMYAINVLQGQTPYQDFLVMYPPGAFYFHAVWLSLEGGTLNGIGVQMLLTHLGAALCLFALIQPVARVRRALLIIPGYFILIAPFEAWYLVLEPITNLFGLAGLAVIQRGLWGPSGTGPWRNRPLKRDLMWIIPAGLLFGVAAMVKQVGWLFPLAGMVCIHAVMGFHRGAMRCSGSLAAAVLFPWLGFFASHPGAVVPFFEQNVLLLFRYAANKSDPTITTMDHALDVAWDRRWLFVLCGLPPLAEGVRLLRDRRSWTMTPPAFLAVLAGMGLMMLVPTLFRTYGHYVLYPLPPAVAGLVWILRESRRRGCLTRLVLLGSALYLFAPFPDPWRLAVKEYQFNYWSTRHKACWMAAAMAGRGPVMVLPDVPNYTYLSNLRSGFNRYWFRAGDDPVGDAASRRLPIIMVNRGNPWIPGLRAALLRHGYSRTGTRGDDISIWTPAGMDPIPSPGDGPASCAGTLFESPEARPVELRAR
ncbi:MAG: hypothetical protein GMKNLPBB_00313 [Myxococcota bacterium]|nr:hypothetical protein [Myxococcota bacterium]